MRFRLLAFLLITLSFSARALSAQNAAPVQWWNDRVFYEIFVRSFYDSDGDGIGDLRGVIEKLDYLNDGDLNTTDDLGITGIWLMPVTVSPTYHGYGVSDYTQIDPDYGTLDDMRALIAAAHERGIAVIIDLVINHTSNQHPWFQASAAGDPEFADWYIWADEDPDYRGPDGQTVWHPFGDRFYYGVFDSSMPDLNLNNPDVTAALYEIARFWLEDVGVDGFRMDAVKHLIEDGQTQVNTPATHAWLSAFDDFIDSVSDQALTVGEVWSSTFDADNYVDDSEVDMTFDFELANALLQSAQSQRSAGAASITTRDFDLYPANQFGIFLSNHDQNRIMSQLNGNVDAAKTAASMLLLGPGVPFLYYGEEIGMEGEKPDEYIRTPMQWDDTPTTAGFTTAAHPWERLGEGSENGISVSAQTDDPASLLTHYRQLIALRNAHPALQHGTFTTIDCNVRSVHSFLRDDGDELLLVLINLSDEPVTDLDCEARASHLSGSFAASVIFGEASEAGELGGLENDGGFSGYMPVASLAPFSTTVIQLTPQ